MPANTNGRGRRVCQGAQVRLSAIPRSRVHSGWKGSTGRCDGVKQLIFRRCGPVRATPDRHARPVRAARPRLPRGSRLTSGLPAGSCRPAACMPRAVPHLQEQSGRRSGLSWTRHVERALTRVAGQRCRCVIRVRGNRASEALATVPAKHDGRPVPTIRPRPPPRGRPDEGVAGARS